MSSPQSFPVACLSFDQIGRLLWSRSYAMAVLFHSQAEWKPYKESTFLNVVYTLMPWKEGPGWVEVKQDFGRVQSHAKELFGGAVDGFMRKMEQGPAAMMQYLADSERIRDEALQAVTQLFASANQINAGVIGETGKTIKVLAVTKASAAIILAGTGGGLVLAGGSVGLVAGVANVNLGYSLTKAVIKNWGELKTVGAVAIELAKDKVPETAGKILEAKGFLEIWQAVPKWEEARQQVMKTSAMLAKKVSARKQAKLGRKVLNAQKDLAHAEAQAAKGAKMMSIGKNLAHYAPVVFAAVDVLDAIGEYQEDIAGL